jgi:hypothetical protein
MRIFKNESAVFGVGQRPIGISFEIGLELHRTHSTLFSHDRGLNFEFIWSFLLYRIDQRPADGWGTPEGCYHINQDISVPIGIEPHIG